MRITQAPSFEKELKRLRKKHPQIDNDIREFKIAVENSHRIGRAIPGYDELIWKYRFKSSDMKKGARDGYRIIGYLHSDEDLFLLTMYYKGEKDDISKNEINLLIHKFIEE